MIFSREEQTSWPPEHKRCAECQEVKHFSEFHKHAQCLLGLYTKCKECRKLDSKKAYSKESPEYRLWYRAQRRANAKGLPFNIKPEDIEIPAVCPVLGVPLVMPGQQPSLLMTGRFEDALTALIQGRPVPLNTAVVSRGEVRTSSPSLDRFDPKKGYVRGNINVISDRANTLKNNASVEELEKVVAWMKRQR